MDHSEPPEISGTSVQAAQPRRVGFGAFKGVYTPSILTILGVIMYLRVGWVLGNAGLWETLLIVTISSGITFLTGLSISAIATNMKVGGSGAGLFSTIGDFFRFAQMLLNGGELEGRRILGRKTVELMMSNHLNHFAETTTPWSDSDGFGLGGSVRIDLARGNRLGSVGQFGWTGLATTSVNIDPREETVVLVFAQHLPYNQHGLLELFNTLFYQALVD